MKSAMTSSRGGKPVDRFDSYLRELLDSCTENPAITGLVLMGSTADRSRVDEWSDHDFAVVTSPEHVEELRGDLAWLPRHRHLAASAREHHDGFKAVYDDGAVIEFAVTDLAGLSTFYANDWEVAYGGAPVLSVMESVAAKPVPDSGSAVVFLTALLVGVGRARRGEALSGGASVRGLALEHLLVLLRAEVPDNLDPRRRFEFAHPRLGAELVAAQELPVEECAREMLAIAERELALPPPAVTAVRSRLGWLP
jgi:hypothetical protein